MALEPVLAQREKDALERAGIEKSSAAIGSRGQAARQGDAVCAWGFVPSPLGQKAVRGILAQVDDAPSPAVIYACYAGTHSSILAGSLHLGLLGDGASPKDLPLFDERTGNDIGVPVLLGSDSNGARVYALGTGWLSAPLERAACDLVELIFPRARVCVCSVRGHLSLGARAGGFASRRLGMVRVGRTLVSRALEVRIPGMRLAVERCLDLTSRWKDNEGQARGEVVFFDGNRRGRDDSEGRKE